MQVNRGAGRINDTNETARDREQRGRIEKLERELEALKKRLPPEPAPAKPEGGKPNA